MRTEIAIRSETDADAGTIADLTIAAFSTLPISNHTEQFIIAALRAAKALTVSLVAEMDGRVVGHIAFSPVAMSDGSPGWYGLGPVSVLPAPSFLGRSRIRNSINAPAFAVLSAPTFEKRAISFRLTRD